MSLWSDRSFLRDVQYQTDANLAARQSIYAYQHPPVNLPGQVLDVALPAVAGGAEVVADVGCGNGAYLAELTRRGYGRRLIGADLSPGMLRAARQRTLQAGMPGPALVAADAAALPLRDSCADLTLAMHMLHHVPEPEIALRDLRRVWRPTCGACRWPYGSAILKPWSGRWRAGCRAAPLPPSSTPPTAAVWSVPDSGRSEHLQRRLSRADIARITTDHRMAPISRTQRDRNVDHVGDPGCRTPGSHPQGQPLVERDNRSDRGPQQPCNAGLACAAPPGLS